MTTPAADATGATMTRTMRKWTARIVGGVIAVTGLGMGGCKHPLFTEPADSPLLRRPNIPPELETQPHAPIAPGSAAVGQDPATVLDLKRQMRPISLKEAIAVAVEQGNSGGGTLGGTPSDRLPQFQGNGVSGTDTIKAFVLDPAIAATNLERSISKFDARWITSMSWQKQDQATLTLQQSFSNGDNAAFNSTLAKPLPTGGVAGITVSVNYLNLSNPPPAASGFVALSTSYTPRVQFVFEQPLLQGFGVEANQLLSSHPGSLLIQGFRSTGQGSEGILIARVRAEQARTQLDVTINELLLNLELAYWNLYAEYYNLNAQQEGLIQAFDSLQFIRQRAVAGLAVPQLVPQYESQYYQFYLRVVEARGRVLEADRALRGLMGLRSDDGTLLAPTDEPVRSPVRIDYKAAYDEGLQGRPEVLLARQDLKARQLELQGQKILRQPDLRLFTSYDVNGLGGRFVGDTSNAFSSLASNQFNSWQVGLRLDMPLGFRDANALVRQSQLQLWRSWHQLGDSERKVYEILAAARRQLDQSYVTMVVNRRLKEATARQARILDERLVLESGEAGFINLAQAQQNQATAAAAEYRALADYNSALARIEYAKGTIQRYNNVTIADGPLPAFVATKAADHFREREAGLKLREHPADQGGGLAHFQMLPLDQMPKPTDLLGVPTPGAGIPQLTAPMPAPQPLGKDGLGAAPVAPLSKPAATTIKSWDEWQAPASGGASIPSSLPQIGPTRTPPTTDPTAGGAFTANGSLSLPKRSPVGAEAPAAPIVPTEPVNTGSGR